MGKAGQAPAGPGTASTRPGVPAESPGSTDLRRVSSPYTPRLRPCVRSSLAHLPAGEVGSWLPSLRPAVCCRLGINRGAALTRPRHGAKDRPGLPPREEPEIQGYLGRGRGAPLLQRGRLKAVPSPGHSCWGTLPPGGNLCLVMPAGCEYIPAPPNPSATALVCLTLLPAQGAPEATSREQLWGIPGFIPRNKGLGLCLGTYAVQQRWWRDSQRRD